VKRPTFRSQRRRIRARKSAFGIGRLTTGSLATGKELNDSGAGNLRRLPSMPMGDIDQEIFQGPAKQPLRTDVRS
jgi:hypothetical protein